MPLPTPRVPRSPSGDTPRRPLASALAAGALLAVAACVPAIPRSAQLPRTAAGAREWRVEPGDVVRVRQWGVSPTSGSSSGVPVADFSGDLLVNDRGEVLVPAVGHLPVQGQRADSVERRLVRAYAGRIDSTRIEVTVLRPVAVLGGVRNPGVQLTDPSATVLSLVARAGGPTRPGGDVRVFLLRVAQPTVEVSTADRVSDLGVHASDELYVQDPPFVVRNEIAIRSVFEALQLLSTALTIYYLVRR